jgi:FAD/FMN-containing dehydrogenase
MNKIAQYLSEHILGEVITSPDIRQAFSTDASLLSITPEMVVYPRITNDLRKIARFAWQLAEKGHAFPITARGGGTDQTGAAIGKGIVVATTAHLNTIFELDVKQKLVRLQPGVTFKALNDALAIQGLMVPSYPASAAYSTVGGAIANNASGVLSGRYGDTAAWVDQLEIVLANGDLLQTGRITKKELNQKKGLQTFEGEIYRQIDGLITDNHALIDSKVASSTRDNSGYGGLAEVKQKDGSIDLTPLFLASQGTLGIISEIIMKASFVNQQHHVGLAAFDNYQVARDAIDDITQLKPALLEIIDGALFADAVARGKKYSFFDSTVAHGVVLLFSFDDFSERNRSRSLKHAVKLLEAREASIVTASQPDEVEALLMAREVSAMTLAPDEHEMSTPPILDGAYVPLERLEDFMSALASLATKHHVALPLYGHALEGVFYARPSLQLKKVSDKQKIFKLLDEYTALVVAHSGHLVGEAAEGRMKSPFAYKYFDDDVLELFQQVKSIFDPYSILNPGVKQPIEIKELVANLRAEYTLAPFSNYSPHN